VRESIIINGMFREASAKSFLVQNEPTQTGKPFAAKASVKFFVIDLSKFQGLVMVAL
jgi:hypothetical protein